MLLTSFFLLVFPNSHRVLFFLTCPALNISGSLNDRKKEQNVAYSCANWCERFELLGLLLLIPAAWSAGMTFADVIEAYKDINWDTVVKNILLVVVILHQYWPNIIPMCNKFYY